MSSPATQTGLHPDARAADAAESVLLNASGSNSNTAAHGNDVSCAADVESDSDFDEQSDAGEDAPPSAGQRVRPPTAVLDDPATTEQDLVTGRSTQKWDRAVAASPTLVKTFNAVAARCRTSNDRVRVSLDNIRTLAEFSATWLSKHRTDIDGFCTRALQGLLKICSFQAKVHRRNESATTLARFYSRIERIVEECRETVFNHARVSLVTKVGHPNFDSGLSQMVRSAREVASDISKFLKGHRPRSDSQLTPLSEQTKRETERAWAMRVPDISAEHPMTCRPDVRKLRFLHYFVRNACPPRPATEPRTPSIEDHMALAERLCEQLEGKSDSFQGGAALFEDRTARNDLVAQEQMAALSSWFSCFVQVSAAPHHAAFTAPSPFLEWKEHSVIAVRMFKQELRLPLLRDINVLSGSTAMPQAVLLALYNLGEHADIVDWAQLVVFHTQQNLLHDSSSVPLLLQVVFALSALAFVLIERADCKSARNNKGYATQAFHAAEAGIERLQPLYDESPSDHRAAMAHLLRLSARALHIHPSTHLNALAKRKLEQAVRLFKDALSSDSQDVDVLIGLADALDMLAEQERLPDTLCKEAMEPYEKLHRIEPLLFATELADRRLRYARHLGQSSDAIIETLQGTIETFEQQERLWNVGNVEFSDPRIVSALRQIAILHDEAGDWEASIASLRTACTRVEGVQEVGFDQNPADGDIESLTLLQMALAHMRNEEYSHAHVYMQYLPGLSSQADYIYALSTSLGSKMSVMYHMHARMAMSRALASMEERHRGVASGIGIEQEDIYYVMARGDNAALECACNINKDITLRAGRRAIRALRRRLQTWTDDSTPAQEATLGLHGGKDELIVQLARQHLLYGASLRCFNRVDKAQHHVWKCIDMIKSTPAGEARWGGPVLKTAYGCYAHILDDQGQHAEAQAAKVKAAEITSYTGFLDYLAETGTIVLVGGAVSNEVVEVLALRRKLIENDTCWEEASGQDIADPASRSCDRSRIDAPRTKTDSPAKRFFTVAELATMLAARISKRTRAVVLSFLIETVSTSRKAARYAHSLAKLLGLRTDLRELRADIGNIRDCHQAGMALRHIACDVSGKSELSLESGSQLSPRALYSLAALLDGLSGECKKLRAITMSHPIAACLPDDSKMFARIVSVPPELEYVA
ncbi:hypothetical protein OC834_004512 [Tilletia horrida]|nr:hypothetical protein OC834_004512 [Tilletia horrida]